jgi:hypothetical protein
MGVLTRASQSRNARTRRSRPWANSDSASEETGAGCKAQDSVRFHLRKELTQTTSLMGRSRQLALITPTQATARQVRIAQDGPASTSSSRWMDQAKSVTDGLRLCRHTQYLDRQRSVRSAFLEDPDAAPLSRIVKDWLIILSDNGLHVEQVVPVKSAIIGEPTNVSRSCQRHAPFRPCSHSSPRRPRFT